MVHRIYTRGQKYWVGIVQWVPETSVSEEIADIFRNYDNNSQRQGSNDNNNNYNNNNDNNDNNNNDNNNNSKDNK